MKKILIMLLLITSLVLSLAACDLSDGDADGDSAGEGNVEDPDGNGQGGEQDGGNNQDGTGSTDSDESVIFSPSVSVTLIKGKNEKELAELADFAERIFTLTNKFATVNTDVSPKDGREIVFGDTARSISAEAKERMEQAYNLRLSELATQGASTKDYTAYAIYCSGGSVAVVWMEEAKSFALEHFEENFLSSPTLYMNDGFLDVRVISMLDYYLKEEEAKREAIRQSIKDMYGEDALIAVEDHLAMFDERFYFWLADLYDPGEYDENGNPLGGGFYYSNSARDYAGFGVDLESTRQVLSFLSTSGMLSGMSLKQAIPEKMQKEMVAFVLACQSPEDGYFYHPQWGTDIGTSRRSRDLSWATSILSSFGARPYWNTPSGTFGTEGEPPGSASAALAVPLCARSAASAAVKLVSDSGVRKWNGSAWLATIDAWDEYVYAYRPENVNGTNVRTGSYGIGNTFSSQAAQITARDRLAIENGELPDADGDGIADGGYIEIFEKYFNEWQIPENGLWEVCSLDDGTVYYSAINGLMKISSCYNSLGIKFPNADRAFDCAAFMVSYLGDGENWADSKGKIPSSSVDVYNPWVSICSLISNVNKYGSQDEADALRAKIRERALELITVTTTKTKKFEKADGSYGYKWSETQTTSQGCPVAVKGTNEGDVNGGTIAFTGVYSNMASALGFSALKPYGREELEAFIARASAREWVDKTPTLYTFDGDDRGTELPEELFVTAGKVEIADDPINGGRAIRMNDSATDSGVTVRVPASKNAKGNCLVLEFDICITDIVAPQKVAFQIRMDKAYMLTLGTTKAGKLTVADASSTGTPRETYEFEQSFDANVWNSFRIEYYILDAEARSTRTKVYVNGTPIGISDNFFGKEDASAQPSAVYDHANFYSLNAHAGVILFDNISAYCVSKSYSGN